MLFCAILLYFMPFNPILNYAMSFWYSCDSTPLCCVISCCSMLFYVTLCCAMLFYAILCDSVQFYTNLCHSILFCSVLCCVALRFYVIYVSMLYSSMLFECYSMSCYLIQCDSMLVYDILLCCSVQIPCFCMSFYDILRYAISLCHFMLLYVSMLY